METPATLRALAALRLEEAAILIQHQKSDGAFYLAGYSVELTLKAKIAERLGVTSLFADQSLETESFPDNRKLRDFVKTHNLSMLLVLSGLRPDYIRTKAASKDFFKFDSLLWTWSEQMRYRSPGKADGRAVQGFINFLQSANGLLQWINNS